MVDQGLSRSDSRVEHLGSQDRPSADFEVPLIDRKSVMSTHFPSFFYFIYKSKSYLSDLLTNFTSFPPISLLLSLSVSVSSRFLICKHKLCHLNRSGYFSRINHEAFGLAAREDEIFVGEPILKASKQRKQGIFGRKTFFGKIVPGGYLGEVTKNHSEVSFFYKLFISLWSLFVLDILSILQNGAEESVS